MADAPSLDGLSGRPWPLAAARSPLAHLCGPRFSSSLHPAPSLPVSLGTHPRRGREEPPGRRCLGPPGYRQSCQGQLVGLSSLGSWGEQQKQKSLGNSEAAKLTYLFCCD